MHTIDYGTQIPGLLVIEDFVTDEEEVALVTEVDSRTWCGLGVR